MCDKQYELLGYLYGKREIKKGCDLDYLWKKKQRGRRRRAEIPEEYNMKM